MAPSRADVVDADGWWASLTDDRRVQYHRWLTGRGKLPPPTQTESLFDLDPETGEIVPPAKPADVSG